MAQSRVGMTGMMRMVGMGGHVMQRGPIVDVIRVIVKAALAALAEFARGVMYVGELHHFDCVFAVEVVHRARP